MLIRISSGWVRAPASAVVRLVELILAQTRVATCGLCLTEYGEPNRAPAGSLPEHLPVIPIGTLFDAHSCLHDRQHCTQAWRNRLNLPPASAPKDLAVAVLTPASLRRTLQRRRQCPCDDAHLVTDRACDFSAILPGIIDAEEENARPRSHRCPVERWRTRAQSVSAD
jgi:hypothetical protein